MVLVVPNSSEIVMMSYILNLSNPQNLEIRLFANDYIPEAEDTVISFVEVNGGGYSKKSLIPSSWFLVAGEPTEAKHREVIWEFDDAVGNVYGYYVTREDSGDLMWAERFKSGPFMIDAKGDKIKVTPKLKLRNGRTIE